MSDPSTIWSRLRHAWPALVAALVAILILAVLFMPGFRERLTGTSASTANVLAPPSDISPAATPPATAAAPLPAPTIEAMPKAIEPYESDSATMHENSAAPDSGSGKGGDVDPCQVGGAQRSDCPTTGP